jgi:hypothetical protein
LFFGKGRKAKTLIEKLQALYVIFVLALLIAYMIVLLAASLDLISSILAQQFDGQLFPNLNLSGWLENSTAIVIFIAIVELFQPNIKEIWKQSAITYTSVVDYLSLGRHRNTIKGQLTNLIEYIAEKQEYDNIHLIAYSFGSIVAIDTIFPINNMPTQRVNLLKTFVTIGCPFDMIRLLWQDYFTNRQGITNIPQRWLNIYSPIDILGSNFRNDNQDGEAQKTIDLTNLNQPEQKTKPENIIYSEGFNSQNLSLIKWLTLMGIRSHLMYWEKTFELELSCFDVLIAKMYENNDFLQ